MSRVPRVCCTIIRRLSYSGSNKSSSAVFQVFVTRVPGSYGGGVIVKICSS